ncbi:MAG: aminoacyl-tRNA hydrolase [Bacilli bacterium]|nr:aminoacyl-tRNA hydrolase [Bacilli bacterium]
MKLIVGLGNPGKKYEGTRHNMGFMTVDLLSDLAQIDVDKGIFNGLLGRGQIFNEDVMIFKPTTYMNLSGTAVQQVVHYFKIDLQDIIVVCDDMAINVGRIRLRQKGSSGGQKGLQNIIDCLGSDQFKRIRVGIGEPEYDSVDFVLGKPTKDELPLIEEAIKNAVEAIKEAIKTDFDRAMTKFN